MKHGSCLLYLVLSTRRSFEWRTFFRLAQLRAGSMAAPKMRARIVQRQRATKLVPETKTLVRVSHPLKVFIPFTKFHTTLLI